MYSIYIHTHIHTYIGPPLIKVYIHTYIHAVDDSTADESLQVIDYFMIALFFISLLIGAAYFMWKIFGKVRVA